MKCVVFYESWQMECCGKAFSIDDTVKWLVYKTEQINTPVDIGRIDYCYEAHSSNWQNLFVFEGKVETIRILYEQYKPTPNDLRLLVPVNGELVEAKRAEGFDKKLNDMEASGYVVVLNEYAIRPAKREEVTFR